MYSIKPIKGMDPGPIISYKESVIRGGVWVPAGSCRDVLPWAYNVQELTYFCTREIKLEHQQQGEKSFWVVPMRSVDIVKRHRPPLASVSDLQV